MERKLYGFNSSQDVVYLQTTLTLFKRVVNIVLTATFEEKLDRAVMAEAFDKLIERNDCLRITFTKKGKEKFQYFEESRKIGEIPEYTFKSDAEMTSFLEKFRKKALKGFKGETLKAAYGVNPDGKDVLFLKFNHLVADDYATNVLLSDLFGIYKALKNGTELPEVPTKFEDVLKKDNDYKSNEAAVEKDRKFFNEYFDKHSEHPYFCGVAGNNSEFWCKQKRKGHFWVPYIFVKCDTQGYRFLIPSAITKSAEKWCEEHSIPLGTFFFYAYCLTTSLVNDKCRNQAPLILLNSRATNTERHCGGTKVQSMCAYTSVDWSKSWNENISAYFEEQNELYRHTKLSYLEVQDIEHKVWNFTQLGQVINFAYSFIPMVNPEGVDIQLQSNGKGALPAYIALMYDPEKSEIYCVYDIMKLMCRPEMLVEFQNKLVKNIETVLEKPDTVLDELM